MKFNEMKLSDGMKSSLEKMGFEIPTDIQAEAIPKLLEGHDIIGQAQTGTGKTAAFGIPIIEKANLQNTDIEALILAPTRELAVQIVDELYKLSKHVKLKIATIIGGVDYNKQIRALKEKPHFVVATPGRIIDHLQNKRLKLDNLKTFIIDEADEMLKVGFKDEIDKIITYLPASRQSALFSATMNKGVKYIAKIMLKDPLNISVSSGMATVDTIHQYAIVVSEKNKLKVLSNLLDLNDGEKCLIFGRTRKRADELSIALNSMGYAARALHGDMSQRERLIVFKEFKLGAFDILVATDVAARGIDITGIKYVYNFDLPQEVEYYTHRIGRTGRAGERGYSYSLVRDSEMPHLKKIEQETKSQIKIQTPPSYKELQSAIQTKAAKKILAMRDIDITKNYQLADTMIQHYGAREIVAAALEVLGDRKDGDDMPSLSGEPPVRISQDTKRKYKSKSSSQSGGGRSRNRNNRSSSKGSGKKYYSGKAKSNKSHSGKSHSNSKRNSK